MLFAFGKRDAFRNRPRFERSAKLQSKIVVKSRGSVFLDYKAAARAAPGELGFGLSGFFEVPLSGIFLEGHGGTASRCLQITYRRSKLFAIVNPFSKCR